MSEEHMGETADRFMVLIGTTRSWRLEDWR